MRVFLVLLILSGAVVLASQFVFRSRGAEARRWVAQESALLLDVRSEREFTAGHLGAMSAW